MLLLRRSNRKILVVILHISCWLLLIGVPFLLRQDPDERIKENSRELLGIFFAIKFVVWIGLFYFNAYFMVPKAIFLRKWRVYFLLLSGVCVFFFLSDGILYSVLLGEQPFHLKYFLSSNFFPVLFILTASTAFCLVKNRIDEDRLKTEKETENLKTELSLLRSQVSPHFMFNIMNNMVALARKKSDMLEPSLIKLSALLRYMLYETDRKVPLQKEIEYLQSYIDLQRQRFGNKVQIKACINQAHQQYEIEPMLLIPFVENAFKHGTGNIEDAAIEINLNTERGMLSFSVQNRFSDYSDEIKDKSSGIGLTNVQRRLSLLYGNKHKLGITKRENWFIVSLQISFT